MFASQRLLRISELLHNEIFSLKQGKLKLIKLFGFIVLLLLLLEFYLLSIP